MADPQPAGVQRRVTQLSGGTGGLKPLQIVENIRSSDRSFSGSRVLQKRHLPISTNKLSFQVDKTDGPTTKRAKTTLSNDKEEIDYREFLELDQAGPAIISYSNNRDCTLVAIKTRRGASLVVMSLLKTSEENVVNLLDCYERDQTVYLVYELMDASLRQVNNIRYER